MIATIAAPLLGRTHPDNPDKDNFVVSAPLAGHHQRNDLDHGAYVTFAVRGRDGGSQAEVDESGLVGALRAAGGGSTRPFVAHTLSNTGHDASEDGAGRGTPLTADRGAVRRLTEVECERLQGFPDN
jgi:site-specific DNA-cytosine methylase